MAQQVSMPSMGGPRFQRGGQRFAPGQRAKNAGSTVKRILKIYLQFGKPMTLVLLLTAVSSLLTVLAPYLTGEAFNTFSQSSGQVDTPLLIKILLFLIAVYLGSWLLTTGNNFLALHVSQQLVYQLRRDFFLKMQRLPLGFYDTTPHGDTMSRLTNDVDNISTTIAQATTQLISSFLTILGSVVMMFLLNVPLTLVVLLCLPLVTFLTRFLARRSRIHFLEQQRSLGILNGIIEENISGLKMVKAFGRQEDVLRQFSRVNEELYKNSRQAQIWSGHLMPFFNVISNLIFALTAITSGLLCAGYGLPIGTAVSFLTYSKQFAHPLNSVASMFNTIQSALAGAERVFELMDQAEELPDPPDACVLKNPQGQVDFSQVSFSYSPEKPVLHQISFHVNPGETIALVGETGAGKTTIVNLLTRFYDADSGTIFIDGKDITHLKRSSLRDCFSVVLQDTCLFTGTILDNIRYARPQATEEEVIEAARLARAHSFISRLPQGYQTHISGSSDTLSQGQRQLLAIARAVLCNSPILILDEATSSVDTKTEKEIQQALLKLMERRTSFLIAHRLSTIRDADRILVIGDGRILEQGTHQQLMKQQGSYYQMVISQMGIIS